MHASYRLEPLLHPRRHGPQVVVHLAGLLAQDEVAHRGAGNLDVLVASQDVDLRGVSGLSKSKGGNRREVSYLGVGEDDAGPRRVLDGEFRLAVLALLRVRGMSRTSPGRRRTAIRPMARARWSPSAKR